ncbi:C40 family peptidase [Paenibacillus ginsengarvi]|uniref:NlpC/P60 family protein n=1 Tax=Paenibacillus ginsengarvi TaxID=400777 RepID=A0A3B0CMJ6_9BACL|nr:C40 family peptidase [Paenibacillus ginsengarvi]RKN85734.1 NlpC/P60 family protein [Paenibacillus ginsengarvi]
MKKGIIALATLLVLVLVPVGSAFAETVLEKTVNEQLGAKYKTAGTTPKGFDCSGFTMFIFNQLGIELPHQSKSQNTKGFWVDKKDLRPGDLVFFNTDGQGISHVGIYLGNDEFIHSATDDGVVKSKLSDKYYKTRYVSARRVIWDELYNQLMDEAK